MSQFVTYVLYSSKFDIIYIGFTSNLVSRFHSHNQFSSKGFTKKYRPWVVIEVEFHSSKLEACTREKFLKSGIGRKYIHEVIIPVYKASDSYPPEAD